MYEGINLVWWLGTQTPSIFSGTWIWQEDDAFEWEGDVIHWKGFFSFIIFLVFIYWTLFSWSKKLFVETRGCLRTIEGVGNAVMPFSLHHGFYVAFVIPVQTTFLLAWFANILFQWTIFANFFSISFLLFSNVWILLDFFFFFLFLNWQWKST